MCIGENVASVTTYACLCCSDEVSSATYFGLAPANRSACIHSKLPDRAALWIGASPRRSFKNTKQVGWIQNFKIWSLSSMKTGRLFLRTNAMSILQHCAPYLFVDVGSSESEPLHTVRVAGKGGNVRWCLFEAAGCSVHLTSHLHQTHHALQLRVHEDKVDIKEITRSGNKCV